MLVSSSDCRNGGLDVQSVHYEDADYEVRADFAESHTRFWQRLQQPGAWFTSAQKIAIAQATREARHCRYCQQRKVALSPRGVQGEHDNTQQLPAAVVEVVHAMVTDASRLSQRWYQAMLEQGLTDAQYVEIVGTVVAMVSIDSFADAIGVPVRTLPAAGSGEPSQYRPATAQLTADAWVPMVPRVNADTPEADLWPSGKGGNVIRAMSLVPDEVRTLHDLSAVHYLEIDKVMQAGVDAGRTLNRTQMELVAGRVSALNACYY